MFSCFIILSLLAVSQAASVVPLQSSQVDVRRSGEEFSYNIQENHGVATIADPLHLVQPLVKTIHIEEKTGDSFDHGKEKHEEHHQDQKVEARGNLEIKELKKPEELALITQPLLTLPLQQYAYYYPYTTLPKTSFIPSLHTYPGIPYPYTLIRTV